MADFMITAGAGRAALLTLLVTSLASAQTRDDIIPGAVRLENGMILKGLCSSGHSISASSVVDHRLDLRRIDQGFRIYYVDTHRSDPIVPDNMAIPSQHFDIIQRSTSQKPMNYAIGLHEHRPFAPDGRSVVSLNLGGGETVEIEVGIIGLDSRFAKVRGLTHRWMYGVSIGSISEEVLYAGRDQPSVLKLVREFDDGEVQLNMVQMLMEADKYNAARELLQDIPEQFPELEPRCRRSVEIWNDRVADRVLGELNRLRATGRTDTARNYARRWPEARLDPVIRVRARQFLDSMEAEDRRVDTLVRSLDTVLAEIDDETLRRQAMQICTDLRKQLDLNTLPRLAAYELLWQDAGLPAASRLALAATGWMLGADHAVDDFAEAYGLFQIRFLLFDYLMTSEDETALRNQLIDRIRRLEGFTVERVGLLLQTLDPDSSVLSQAVSLQQPRRFAMEAAEDSAACLGQVPREYVTTRRYPLLIAFSRGGGTSEMTLNWWSEQAERHGYVLVVPEIYQPTDGNYDASAAQHRQLLGLIRQLKSGLAIDDDRVFIVGHGIGAEAAMDFATAHPDLFAGVASLAGLGRKHLLWTVHNSSSLPWYVVAGTRQPYYPTRTIPLIRKLFDRVTSPGRIEYCNAMFAAYPECGFESYAEELQNIFQWMGMQKRPSYGDRIRATTLRSTDLSWYWLELESIQERFVSMDQPSTPEDRPTADGHIDAEINGNMIRLRTLPGPGFVRLSPDVPELNLGEPVRIAFSGRGVTKVDYIPSLRDLLEDYRRRRDRTRLCLMKVPVE
ncbi:MAG: hypothetical protein RIK87_25380 [Fuerstiella sp.]